MSIQGKIRFLEHAADCARREGWLDVAVKLQQEAEEVAASVGIRSESEEPVDGGILETIGEVICDECGEVLGDNPSKCDVCFEEKYPGVCPQCGEKKGRSEFCETCRDYSHERADELVIDRVVEKDRY